MHISADQEFSSIAIMFSGHSLYVLPSTGPDMSERKSSAQGVTKSTPRAVFQTLPYHCGVDIRKHTAHAAPKIRERRQRRQNDAHVSRGPIVAKAELQSERYNAYREKQRGNTKKPQVEQVWTDELEGVFQLGGLGRMSWTPTTVTKLYYSFA